jgi:hypothetical protein
MDLFFRDPEDIPLPPDQVRIRKFSAEPWPDGRRVKIIFELTPFLKRPSGEITLFDAHGEEAASLSIIETMDPRLEFTVHLRGAELVGPFRAVATLFYREEPELPEPGQATGGGSPAALGEAGREMDFDQATVISVDRAEITFEIPTQAV